MTRNIGRVIDPPVRPNRTEGRGDWRSRVTFFLKKLLNVSTLRRNSPLLIRQTSLPFSGNETRLLSAAQDDPVLPLLASGFRGCDPSVASWMSCVSWVESGVPDVGDRQDWQQASDPGFRHRLARS